MEPWRGAPDLSCERTQDELAAAGLTDGLPLIPPTAERVAYMLKACGLKPGGVLAVLPPSYNQATWQDVAINAVMAGCRAEYLPVVGAAIAAIAADEFNLLGIATTTGSATPLVIVNGPIAREIGMNAEANALGQGNRANATIGRAVHLALQNIGGAKSGETDMATLGQPGKYTFCFAENESASPWPPLHVERGFAATASVVTVVGASGTIEVVDSESQSAADLTQTFAQSMLIAGNVGSAGLFGGGEPLIIMPPEHAMVFHHEGYTKEQVKAAIYERAVLSVDRLSAPMRERVRANAAAEGVPDVLRIAKSPRDVMIVVAGGVGRKAVYVPTWSGTTRAVSRALPA